MNRAEPVKDVKLPTIIHEKVSRKTKCMIVCLTIVVPLFIYHTLQKPFQVNEM